MRRQVILFIVLLLLHVFLYAGALNPSSLTVFGNLMQGMALLFAAMQFSRFAGTADKQELGSRISIALGLWVCLMAHLLLSYSELLLGKAATGTVTDLLWLAGYGLIARGLSITIHRNLSKSQSIYWHLCVPVVTALIVSAALWKPLTDTERTILVRFVQFIFPLLDLWIAATAFLVAYASGVKAWALMGFGSLVIGTADLIFPYFHTISSPVYRFLDIPLFAGYSMWWLSGASLRTVQSKS